MCDAMRELPAPGSELYMYREEDEGVAVGDTVTVPMGDLGSVRAKVTKVKPSRYFNGRCQVNVEVISHV